MTDVKGMNSFCYMIDESTIHKSFSKNSTKFAKFWFSIPINKLVEKTKDYYKDLCDAQLSIPSLKSVKVDQNDCISIEQQFIKGKILSQELPNLTKNASLLLYKNILEMQKKAFHFKKSLRLDLNIDNFILSENGMVLVDIMPPLYDGAMEFPKEYIDQCYYFLCYSIENQICETIYSFFKKRFLVTRDIEDLKSYFDDLIRSTHEIWHSEKYGNIDSYFSTVDYHNHSPATRTFARLKLIQAFCSGEISLEEYIKLIKTFSFTIFFQNQK